MSNQAHGTATSTTVVNSSEQPEELVLRLGGHSSSAERRHIVWSTDTVDNEGMGKKKSKCCCIYKKPKSWQDSSSDSDSDCETGHCRGHVEKRKEHNDDKPPPSTA
ncbi:unnamed protein product [Caenorhabditis auriculariae]|uniref:E3 ubiquitin-protein ligase PPP1R11 n=1 Tax=Caenorhabditis auriculariae TaxID=2777116 RepID=A0A8S1GYF0_9PELO|nr:unnamed protein product [Caenorhabditis auriculariae]